MTFSKRLEALRGDERGVTALEYGLIAALIAVVVVVSVSSLGTAMSSQFSSIGSSISTASK